MRKTNKVYLEVSRKDYFNTLEMIEEYKGIRTITFDSEYREVSFDITNKNLKVLKRDIELLKQFGVDIKLKVA